MQSNLIACRPMLNTGFTNKNISSEWGKGAIQYSNLSLNSLYDAKACKELAGPISMSLRPGNTATFEEISQRWRAVGNTVSDLTGPRFEPWTSRSSDKHIIARPTGYAVLQKLITTHFDSNIVSLASLTNCFSQLNIDENGLLLTNFFDL